MSVAPRPYKTASTSERKGKYTSHIAPVENTVPGVLSSFELQYRGNEEKGGEEQRCDTTMSPILRITYRTGGVRDALSKSLLG